MPDTASIRKVRNTPQSDKSMNKSGEKSHALNSFAPRSPHPQNNRRPLTGSPVCNDANYLGKLAAAAEKREEAEATEEGGGGLGDY
jgi:hypothetical protein